MTLDAPPQSRISFWLVIGLISIIGCQKAFVTPLDPDLFWHLRVADQLRADGIGPIVDRISFSSRAEPWTPYSWLAELGMRAVWNICGYRGTIILQALSIVGTIVLIALSCLEMTAGQRRMNCVLAVACATYLTLPYLSFRPATFAIFWLALCTWLLLRDRQRGEKSRAVWLVAPITLLLANVHLAAVMVPIWIACLFAVAIRERKGAARYAILLACTSLACLATPMLPGVIRSMWDYQFHDVMVNSRTISEMTPVYAGVWGICTVSVIGLLVLWGLRHRERIRLGEWVWLFAAAAMMLRLGRFAPMFAMIAAPVLAAALPAMGDAALIRKPVRVALALVGTLCLIKLAWQFPRPGESLDAFLGRDDSFAYPCAAARFVETNIKPVHGRLINEFTWGGYLGWRLGDRYQVFLDGRTQVFPAEFWNAVMLGDDASRKAVIARANADVAIIPAKKSQFKKALEDLGWTKAYADDRAEVLIPPAGPR